MSWSRDHRCQAPPQQNLSKCRQQFLATTSPLLQLTQNVHPPPHMIILLLAMADTDFHDQVRIGLLTTLAKALPSVPSTVWSYLWFSDIDRLRALAQHLQLAPLVLIDKTDRHIVQMCEFIHLYTFS